MHWIDKTFGAALGVSLLLHGGGVSAPVVYQWWTGMPWPLPHIEAPAKMTFEFIDSPDSAVDEKKKRQTSKISNKTTQARDLKVDLKQTKEGPALPVNEEVQALAKKIIEDRRIQQKEGGTSQKAPLSPQEKLPEKKQNLSQELLDKEGPGLVEEQKNPVQKKMASSDSMPGNSQVTQQMEIFNPAQNRDHYASSEVQKFLATAVNVGEVAFDAKKHILGEYLKELESRIAPQWILKIETNSIGSLIHKKKVVLGFKIWADGRLGEVLIIQDYGDNLFNKVCVETITEVAPFQPLPQAWLEQSGLDYLNLVYTFTVL